MTFIQDLFSFIKFKILQKKFKVGFFCENRNIQSYLIPYIKKKAIKKKIFVISIEDIDLRKLDNISLFTFKSKFFIEIFFLTLKVKYFYSSTPDLNNSLFVKSRLFGCKYIYLQHSPVSIIKAYNNKAFDCFNAIQAINKFQYNEIHEINKIKNLNIKAFKSKYAFFNQKTLNENKTKYDVLIAPTWKSNFYKLNCHNILINFLNKKKLTYKLRPHYMSLRKKEVDKKSLINNKVNLDEDFNINFDDFKFLVSDWSGIFIEYSIIKKIKPFLINSTQKILNSNKDSYNFSIEEISRNQLGNTYNIDEIEKLVDDILILRNNNSYNKNDKELIDNFYKKYFY